MASDREWTAAGFLIPDWDAPSGVRAVVSTRRVPGVSLAPFDDCNLGDHVGDDPIAVRRNRARLHQFLDLPAEPLWLNQVHGSAVHQGSQNSMSASASTAPQADAAFTHERNVVLAVLTADCLPLLFASADGSEIAAVHAGWRGLAAGVIEATVRALRTPPEQLHVWLGPAIGPKAFEVGEEVYAAFVDGHPSAAAAFGPSPVGRSGQWLCDLYQLSRLRLRALGLQRISGGQHCTYSEPARFYSYRRDRDCGRMASLIWLKTGA